MSTGDYLKKIRLHSKSLKFPKPCMMNNKLNHDVSRDGMLDSDEFALAMHLMNIKLDGEYLVLLMRHVG